MITLPDRKLVITFDRIFDDSQITVDKEFLMFSAYMEMKYRFTEIEHTLDIEFHYVRELLVPEGSNLKSLQWTFSHLVQRTPPEIRVFASPKEKDREILKSVKDEIYGSEFFKFSNIRNL